MRGQLRAAERLYAALLALYPREFRAAYGPQMRQTFRDASQAAYRQKGKEGLLFFWLPTLLDLVKTALEERARRGVFTMTRDRYLKWAGPLTILVGSLWLVASAGEMVLLTHLGSPDTFWDVFWLGPVILSYIVMLPAFILTRLRLNADAGTPGRLGLALSIAGVVGMYGFFIVSAILGAFGIEQVSWPNYVMAVCIFATMFGHILWGIDAMKNKLLPRWNAMPLLVGLPSLLLAVPSLLIDSTTPHRFEAVLVTTFSRFFFTGLFWVLLGAALTNPKPETQLAEVP